MCSEILSSNKEVQNNDYLPTYPIFCLHITVNRRMFLGGKVDRGVYFPKIPPTPRGRIILK